MPGLKLGSPEEQSANEGLSDAARVAQLPLPRRPRIPRWITVYKLGDDRLQLASPTLSYTITLPLFTQVFQVLSPLLDGTREIETLLQATSDFAEPSTTVFLLKSLYANGIVYEGDTSLYPSITHSESWETHTDFFASFTPNPISTIATITRSPISLIMPCHLAEILENNLRSLGIEHITVLSPSNQTFPSKLEAILRNVDGDSQPLIISALDGHQRHLFNRINEVCLEHGTRWLHIDGRSTHITLGPTFVPYQTACYTCFCYRLSSHLPYQLDRTDDDEFVGGIQRNEGAKTFIPLWRLAFAHAALECARLLTGFASPTTIGRCHEIGGMTMTATSHDVMKLPRCPSCGVAYTFKE